MVETRDSSSSDVGAISPERTPYNDLVALRVEDAERRFSWSAACDIPYEASSAAVDDHELRAFCARLLGWSPERVGVVDDAMKTLFTAFVRKIPVALSGESDLVPIAYSLHRRLLGAAHPFVVCDPQRHRGEGSVRSPPNRRTGLQALQAAANGSVCLRSNRLPTDFELFMESLQQSRHAVIVFVCLRRDDLLRDLLCRPLAIPSLAQRTSEFDRLLDEALDDASEMLGGKRVRPSPRIRRSIFKGVTSFTELEKTALRLVALASTPNVSQAALQLKMAPVSLSRWLGRRRWAAAISNDAKAYMIGDDG
jgi:hypothetical protein